MPTMLGEEHVLRPVAAPSHDTLDVLGLRAVAAQEPMVTKGPEVARPRYRLRGGVPGAGVVDVVAGVFELGKQRVDVLVRVAHAIEIALGAQLLEQFR